MRILVNHLTRMSGNFVCVAGLSPQHQHIRPVPTFGRLERGCLQPSGPFELGSVVELGSVQRRGIPPEIEDVEFDLGKAKFVAKMTGLSFLEQLMRVKKDSLPSIFGDVIELRGRRAVVDEGQGEGSLGCLALKSGGQLAIRWGKLRLDIDDPVLGELELPVTDIRCFDQQLNPDEATILRVQQRIQKGERFLLSVGLTRPWAPFGDIPVHWVQVNNLFPVADPLWESVNRATK